MMTATDVESSLSLLHEPGEVFEIRILNTARAGTVSGYFDDFAAAAAEIAKWDGKAPGVYTTLNPVEPALMARAANRLRERARDTTSDRDILRRRWLLIDVDFHRPSGISSTRPELQAAGQVAKRIEKYLTGLGWPAPILVMSGNGAHLLYRVDLDNDTPSRDLLKRLLERLAKQFDQDGAEVDTTVHNAARIVKVPGTMACKGDNLPERPHRRSRIVVQPKELASVGSAGLLEAAGPEPPKPASASASGNGRAEFDVEEWMQRYGLAVRVHKTEGSGDLWELAVCPFNPDHDKGEAFVTRDASGSLLAGCHHNSCTWRWPDLRERFEPEYREKQSAWERGREAALAAAYESRDTSSVELPAADFAHVFIDWSTFWNRDHSEEEWVFPDVLARGRGHAIYAIHKAGKSLLMLYMAAAIATGSAPVVVVYLDYEMTEEDIFDRLDDMGHGPGTDFSRLRYALLPTLPKLDTAAGGKALMALVDGVQAEWPEHHIVVVIDTISRAVCGKENDADTFRDFYSHTGIQLKRRGVTWARLDHGGKDGGLGQRGSSGKGDDVDVVWKLTTTQNGIKLHRELARMSWVPENVVLGLSDEPLRYQRLAGDWPDGTGEVANILNRLRTEDGEELPLNISTRAAQKAVREIGEGRRREVVCAAIRWRKERAQDKPGTTYRHGPQDAAGDQTPEPPKDTPLFEPESGSGTTGNSSAGQVWEPGGVTSREPPAPADGIEMDDMP